MKKINTSNDIKQITDNGYAISDDGKVYIIYDENLKLVLLPGINNIVQIVSRYNYLKLRNL